MGHRYAGVARAFLSLALLFCFGVLGSHSVNAVEPSIRDYWDNVSLTLEQAKAEIDFDRCYSDSTRYLACAEVIQTLLKLETDLASLVPEVLEVSPKTEDSSSPGNKLLFRADDLVVVEHPVRDVAWAPALVSEDWPDTLSGHYDRVATRDQRASFEDLFDWAIERLDGSDLSEAWLAGRVINAFYSVYHDPHTRLVPRAHSERLRRRGDTQTYYGIGVWLRNSEGRVWISQVSMEGTARAAGLELNDTILSVGGVNVAGMTHSEVAGLITGSQGSVDLMIQRQEETLQINVPLQEVVIENVSARVIPSTRVGHIRIRSFMEERTFVKAIEAVARLQRQVDGWVVDLRGNRGGFVSDARRFLDSFVGEGRTLFNSEDLDGQTRWTYRSEKPSSSSKPLVVIVDSQSASASEIFAGAVQDLNRGWVIGDRTYGKASIQIIEDSGISADLDIYRTTGRYTLPSGRSVQLTGLEPDLYVGRTPDEDPRSIPQPREIELYRDVLPELDSSPRSESEARSQKRLELMACLEERSEQSGPPEISDYRLGVAARTVECLL